MDGSPIYPGHKRRARIWKIAWISITSPGRFFTRAIFVGPTGASTLTHGSWLPFLVSVSFFAIGSRSLTGFGPADQTRRQGDGETRRQATPCLPISLSPCLSAGGLFYFGFFLRMGPGCRPLPFFSLMKTL